MGQKPSSTAGRPIKNRRNRRGVTVVIVLAMISMTLALSYSIMRSQTTAVQIQANSSRRSFARDAAITGLTIALRKMHEPGWGGIGSTITGSVNSTDRYEARYEAGDAPTLDAQGFPADVDDYFEVKVFSTGFSSDPSNSNPATRHSASAVVRLIREKRTDRPSVLAEEYTVYQTGSSEFLINPPTRIEGPVASRGDIRIGKSYQWREEARDRYLRDLHATREHRYEWGETDEHLSNGDGSVELRYVSRSIPVNSFMRIAGSNRVHRITSSKVKDGEAEVWFSPTITTTTGIPNFGARVELYETDTTADYRPLTGPILIASNALDASEKSYLETVVGVQAASLGGAAPGNWLPVAFSSNYRLYPGGPEYSAVELPDRIDNRTLGPSLTNPLAVFYSDGDLALGDNVTLEGTLFVRGQLTLAGSGTQLRPPSAAWKKLLSRESESSALELPVLVTGNHCRIQKTAIGSIDGLVMVRNHFLVERRHQHSGMAITGRVIAEHVNLGTYYTGQSGSWDNDSNFWTARYEAFLDHQQWENPLTVRFTEWMLWHALDFGVVRRGLLIKPSQNAIHYHWQSADKPVFVEAAEGAGLRWDVLEWKHDI